MLVLFSLDTTKAGHIAIMQLINVLQTKLVNCIMIQTLQEFQYITVSCNFDLLLPEGKLLSFIFYLTATQLCVSFHWLVILAIFP